MQVKQPHQLLPYIIIGVLLYWTMIVQGGYFALGHIIVNIGFIALIVLIRIKHICEPTSILLSLLAIYAGLVGLLNAQDLYIAFIEWLKYLILPLAFILFRELAHKQRIEKLFQGTFILLMVAGIAAVIGIQFMPGMVTLQGNRLQSFLQYANTTALIMGIGALFSFEKFRSTKAIGDAVILGGFIVALILTQSRISLVIFVLIALIYAIRMLSGRVRYIFLGSIALIFASLVAMGGRIVKISFTEATLIERIITYQDAFSVMFSHIFGLGLGNWQFMQFSVQSAPYQVRYIHNTYLHTGAELGVIGFILLCAVILLAIISIFRFKSIYSFIALFIILHSFFEVNFNYAIVLLYFMFVLTQLLEPKPVNKLKLAAIIDHKAYRSASKLVLMIPMLLLLWSLSTELLIKRANEQAPQHAVSTLMLANKLNPFYADIWFQMAKHQHNSTLALGYLEETYAINPYHYIAVKAMAEGHLFKEQYAQAIYYAEQLYHMFPYNKQHQLLLQEIAQISYEHNEMSELEYRNWLTNYNRQLGLKDESINRLYRFINDKYGY